MSMFPGANAQVYYNEAGEPLGWDYPSEDDPYDDDRGELPLQAKCDICGERFKRGDEVAEMYDPVEADNEMLAEMYGTVICHAQCGLNKGLELA